MSVPVLYKTCCVIVLSLDWVAYAYWANSSHALFIMPILLYCIILGHQCLVFIIIKIFYESVKHRNIIKSGATVRIKIA